MPNNYNIWQEKERLISLLNNQILAENKTFQLLPQIIRIKITEKAMLDSLMLFLEQDLFISFQSLQLALKRSSNNYIFRSMVLFQYGIMDLGQLENIFDWIDNYPFSRN